MEYLVLKILPKSGIFKLWRILFDVWMVFKFLFLVFYKVIFLKRLWLWINLHKEEPLANTIYALNASFIYMIVSRGYLPQQIHLYIFTLFPVFAIYFLKFKDENLIIK